MQCHCWSLDSFLRDSFLALGPLSQSLGSACTVSSDPMWSEKKRGSGGLSGPEAAVTLPAEPASRPHRKGEITQPPQRTAFSAPSLKQQKVFNGLPCVFRAPTFFPQAQTAGWLCDSPHIRPIALANLKGKPNEMFGEVDCRGHSTSKRSGGLRQGSSRTVTRRPSSSDGLPLLPVPLVGVHSFYLANGILEISYGKGNRQEEMRCQ